MTSSKDPLFIHPLKQMLMKRDFTKFCLLSSLLIISCTAIRAQEFAWAKQITGTSQVEEGKGIGLDASGNVYSAGIFADSADLDPGAGTQMAYTHGGDDIYVQKLDMLGNLVWAFSIGGSSTDIVHDLYTDLAGNVYITGQFKDTVDFDPGAGVTNLMALANDDIFFAKYNASGALVWAHRIGGTANDQGHGITADLSGNVYITGYFKGIVDFDPGANVANLTGNGIEDIFVAKYNSSGNYLWAHSAGGANTDMGQSIAVDYMGNVLVTGNFNGASVDFDPGPATVSLSTNGLSDIFVASYNDTGKLNWAKSIGSDSTDDGLGIITDLHRSVFVTGYFRDTADFDPGPNAANLMSAGDQDIYILKLDSAGSFSWVKQIGGIGADAANAIDIDYVGAVYLTGYYTGTVDFDPDPSVSTLPMHGNEDIFVGAYSNSGALVWAVSMGSSADDNGNAIIPNTIGEVFSTGFFKGICDFDPGVPTFNLTAISNQDGYVQKLTPPEGAVKNTLAALDAAAYPNPLHDRVVIQADKQYTEIKTTLCDVTGRTLIARSYTDVKSFEVDMSGLADGIYFLHLQCPSGSRVMRLVKE